MSLYLFIYLSLLADWLDERRNHVVLTAYVAFSFLFLFIYAGARDIGLV